MDAGSTEWCWLDEGVGKGRGGLLCGLSVAEDGPSTLRVSFPCSWQPTGEHGLTSVI